MVEYGHKIEEEVKAMQSEIKKKYTGNKQWREGNQDSHQWFGAEGRNKHSSRTEWRNKNSKNEESLRNLQDNFQHSNIWIIGVPEGEEEEQEIENLFEKNNEGNFPNLEKEIDTQVQQTQRVPNKLDPKRNTPRHIIIMLPKIK